MLSGIDFLNDPNIGLPVAAALISGRDNRDAFSRGFSVLGDARQSARERQMMEDEKRRQEQQRNLTLEFLQRRSPDLAAQVSAGMPASEAWKTYNKIQTDRADGTEYGLKPIFGEDNEGNTLIGTLGKDGTFKQIQMPGDFRPSSGVDRVDAGDHYILLNKRTGEAVGTLPKNIAEEQKQKVIGKAEGEKEAGRDNSLAQMQDMLRVIQDVKNDPGREGATGGSRIFNAPFGFTRPGSQTANFDAKLEQLKGKAFLQAFETLKGGGQITEREGIAAQNAIARLQTSQSDEEFLQALNDLEAVVNRAMTRLQDGESAAPTSPGEWSSGPNGTRIRQIR